MANRRKMEENRTANAFNFTFRISQLGGVSRFKHLVPRLCETFPFTDICLVLPLLCILGSASFHPFSFFLMLSFDQFMYILHFFKYIFCHCEPWFWDEFEVIDFSQLCIHFFSSEHYWRPTTEHRWSEMYVQSQKENKRQHLHRPQLFSQLPSGKR